MEHREPERVDPVDPADVDAGDPEEPGFEARAEMHELGAEMPSTGRTLHNAFTRRRVIE